MKLAVATTKDRLFSLVFSAVVGALFASGFIAASQKLYSSVSHWIPKTAAPWSELKEMSFFPLLAILFFISLPKRKSERVMFPNSELLKLSILPILIAFGFGKAIGNSLHWNLSDNIVNTLWYLVFIPLGEEYLFRGWVFGILDRVWPGVLFTMTNALPVAVWGSSLAFSVWHAQNFGTASLGLVLLQVFYTFITGLWLGLLRSKTGQVWPCVIAHFLINLAAGC